MISTEPFEFPQPHTDAFICDRHVEKVPSSHVYLLYSPQINAYKIGRTKNAQSFRGRLKERIRQCGDTKVMALWRCHPNDAPMVEKELLEKAKPYRTGREILEWHSDFISFYAIFMASADWKIYSMDLIWTEPMSMKNFRYNSTTVDCFLHEEEEGCLLSGSDTDIP